MTGFFNWIFGGRCMFWYFSMNLVIAISLALILISLSYLRNLSCYHPFGRNWNFPRIKFVIER